MSVSSLQRSDNGVIHCVTSFQRCDKRMTNVHQQLAALRQEDEQRASTASSVATRR
jgi:hypothetical protein